MKLISVIILLGVTLAIKRKKKDKHYLVETKGKGTKVNGDLKEAGIDYSDDSKEVVKKDVKNNAKKDEDEKLKKAAECVLKSVATEAEIEKFKSMMVLNPKAIRIYSD